MSYPRCHIKLTIAGRMAELQLREVSRESYVEKIRHKGMCEGERASFM